MIVALAPARPELPELEYLAPGRVAERDGFALVVVYLRTAQNDFEQSGLSASSASAASAVATVSLNPKVEISQGQHQRSLIRS